MESESTLLLLSLLLLLLLVPAAGTADAQEAVGPGIAWHGTLEAGLAEARRTNRPILLMAAAPQCHNISGMW